MRRDHRITTRIDADGRQRCGSCGIPVNYTAVPTKRPCRCDEGAPYAICGPGHLVVFIRHWPERAA